MGLISRAEAQRFPAGGFITAEQMRLTALGHGKCSFGYAIGFSDYILASKKGVLVDAIRETTQLSGTDLVKKQIKPNKRIPEF